MQLDRMASSIFVLFASSTCAFGIQTLWRQMRLSSSTNRGTGSAGINALVEKHDRPLTQHTPLNDLQQRRACSPFSSCVAFFPPRDSRGAEKGGR